LAARGLAAGCFLGGLAAFEAVPALTVDFFVRADFFILRAVFFVALLVFWVSFFPESDAVCFFAAGLTEMSFSMQTP
jgi:hypothetical protein